MYMMVCSNDAIELYTPHGISNAYGEVKNTVGHTVKRNDIVMTVVCWSRSRMLICLSESVIQLFTSIYIIIAIFCSGSMVCLLVVVE